jgi:Skp family chaperone for outer membrane proteins
MGLYRIFFKINEDKMYKKLSLLNATLLLGSSMVLAEEKVTVKKDSVKVADNGKSIVVKSNKNDLGIKDLVALEGIKLEVFNEAEIGLTKDGIEIQKHYETRKQDITAELKEEQKKLIEANTEYTTKQATLSEAARGTEEKKIAAMERNLRVKSEEKRQELEAEMYKKMEELSTRFEQSVAEYSKKKGVNLVLGTSGKVIYASDDLKCTEAIVQKMNESHEKRLAQNKKAVPATTTAKATDSAKKATA